MLAFSSLVLIPAFIGAAGIDTWGAIATGQAVGALGSVITAYGWGLSGPSSVAAVGRADALLIFLDSFRMRAVLGMFVCFFGLTLCVLLDPSEGFLTGLGFLSTWMISLGSSWFLIGRSLPWKLLLLETLPRAVANVLAASFLLIQPDVYISLLIVISGVMFATVASVAWVLAHLGYSPRRNYLSKSLMSGIRAQRSAFAAGVVSAANAYMPLIMLNVFAPAAVGYFAVLDKVLKQASTGLSPLTNYLQGWVPQDGASALPARIYRALAAAAIFGGLIVLGVTFVGAPVLSWLAAGEDFRQIDLMLLGLTVGGALIESVMVRAGLVPLGATACAVRAATVGLIVTVVGLIPLALVVGSTGALAAVAIGYMASIAMEGINIFKILRQRQRSPQVQEIGRDKFIRKRRDIRRVS